MNKTKTAELSSKHGFTLGHLHESGGRELECILERYECLSQENDRLKAKIDHLQKELQLNLDVIALWHRRAELAEADNQKLNGWINELAQKR